MRGDSVATSMKLEAGGGNTPHCILWRCAGWRFLHTSLEVVLRSLPGVHLLYLICCCAAYPQT